MNNPRVFKILNAFLLVMKGLEVKTKKSAIAKEAAFSKFMADVVACDSKYQTMPNFTPALSAEYGIEKDKDGPAKQSMRAFMGHVLERMDEVGKNEELLKAYEALFKIGKFKVSKDATKRLKRIDDAINGLAASFESKTEYQFIMNVTRFNALIGNLVAFTGGVSASIQQSDEMTKWMQEVATNPKAAKPKFSINKAGLNGLVDALHKTTATADDSTLKALESWLL
jgi:hypothetical protein